MGKYRHQFCLIMLILSLIGFFWSVILIVNDGNDNKDWLRAAIMFVTAASFYTLMEYYRKKNNKKG